MGEVPMAGVREYAEGLGVSLMTHARNGRAVVRALNEAGHDHTQVDLLDLLRWVKANRPDLWAEASATN